MLYSIIANLYPTLPDFVDAAAFHSDVLGREIRPVDEQVALAIIIVGEVTQLGRSELLLVFLMLGF